MVDAARVVRLLQRIQADVEHLTGRDPEALLQDFDALAATKYLFITAIEGCVDVAQHLCASEGWGRPESNADALRELGRRGVLEGGLAESIARAAGFRNVLVHGYADVEDRKVAEALGRVSDLRDFVRSVSGWIDAAADSS